MGLLLADNKKQDLGFGPIRLDWSKITGMDAVDADWNNIQIDPSLIEVPVFEKPPSHLPGGTDYYHTDYGPTSEPEWRPEEESEDDQGVTRAGMSYVVGGLLVTGIAYTIYQQKNK